MKSPILRATCCVVFLMSLNVSPAVAAKAKVWHHHDPVHFENARFDRTVMSDFGSVRLARQLKPLADLKAMHIWDLAEDSQGNLFVATGDDGKLFKISPEGKVTLIHTSTDSQILSLAACADGSIYAGTGPSGKLIKISPKGKAHVVADNLGSYVWALALDPESKTVYAGTGPKGQIYQVGPDGKATVFYTTKQNHVLCLARDADRMLYAGTDKGGMVYRISPKGKGFVLYTAPQSEVRSLLVTAKGIYAGTSSPSGKYKSQAVVDGKGDFTPLDKGIIVPVSGKKGPDEKITKALEPSEGSRVEDGEEAGDPEKGKSAPTLAPPGVGENSLYCISREGAVSELFRDKAMILSLAQQHGSFVIGTGMKGQLFEINEKTKERTEIARLDHGQIHCMLKRRDGSLVLGTGDPGKLYVLSDEHEPQGTVTSDVLDAKHISKWGSVDWKAKQSTAGAVTLSFRSGNVPTPDETWSDWTEEQEQPNSVKVNCPAARFMQYKVTLTSGNPRATPSFQGLTLRYLPTNHAPEVSKIEVPDMDGKDQEKPEKISIKWRATDPNEDELTFSVYARKEGWQTWICLKDNLAKREYQWDAGTMPSGHYQVKVVASDSKDNTDKETLLAEAVSSLFPVVNLPPKVSLKVVAVENGKAVLEASADDPMIRICHAAYAIDGKAWVNVFPDDGIFDGKSETFRFSTNALTPGNHVVVVRVRNAAGHIASADAVITVPGKGDHEND